MSETCSTASESIPSPEKYDLCFNGTKIAEIAVIDKRTVGARMETSVHTAMTRAYFECRGFAANDSVKSTWLHCKTRKRYVKLLMATGMSRNIAHEWAEFTQSAADIVGGYQDVWVRYLKGSIYPRKHTEGGS